MILHISGLNRVGVLSLWVFDAKLRREPGGMISACSPESPDCWVNSERSFRVLG